MTIQEEADSIMAIADPHVRQMRMVDFMYKLKGYVRTSEIDELRVKMASIILGIDIRSIPTDKDMEDLKAFAIRFSNATPDTEEWISIEQDYEKYEDGHRFLRPTVELLTAQNEVLQTIKDKHANKRFNEPDGHS